MVHMNMPQNRTELCFFSPVNIAVERLHWRIPALYKTSNMIIIIVCLSFEVFFIDIIPVLDSISYFQV